jgi:hypothetical protein
LSRETAIPDFGQRLMRLVDCVEEFPLRPTTAEGARCKKSEGRLGISLDFSLFSAKFPVK